MGHRLAGLMLAAWLAWAVAAAAQDLPPVPPFSAHVMDSTGMLSEGQRQALETRLAAFEQARGVRVALLLVAGTQPEGIAAYTRRVGEAWRMGPGDPGDGLLLVVAGTERAVRIAPTMELQGLIPDAAAGRIIEQHIRPRFNRGDIAGGLAAGTDALMALVSDDTPIVPDIAPGGLAGWDILWIEVVVFLLLALSIGARLLLAGLGRRRASLAMGIAAGMLVGYLGTDVLMGAAAAVAGVLFAWLSLGLRAGATGLRSTKLNASALGLGGGNWRAGSGSGSSSGGFSSGGGGDFGGGGASGGW